MHALSQLTSLLVLTGSLFMAAAIILGQKTKRHIPHELKLRWRLMITLMYFFLAGYLSFLIILVNHIALPTEVVTGPVFLGGAFFVFIVINLTREVIRRIKAAEENLKVLNESLEQRVAERTQELQHSQEFLKTVIDSLNDSVAIIDVKNYTIVGTNAVFLKETGMTEDEITGRTCYEITHDRHDVCGPPDDICPLTETVVSGKPAMAEHVHYDKFGNKVYVEVSTSPIKGRDGEISQVVHVSRDITERKLAENALRENEKHLRNILDSIHAGIMVIDPAKHEIVDVNTYAAQLIGEPRDEVVGRICHQFVCPAAADHCPITDRHEIVDNSERVLVKADGTQLPILKSVVPVEYRGEQYLIESFIDIQRIKEFEQELSQLNEKLKNSYHDLQERNEELKAFVYSISHDLRSPLVNIKGFSGELGNSLKDINALMNKCVLHLDPEEQARLQGITQNDIPAALNFISTSSDKIDDLINSFLKLSRIGRRELVLEEIDMGSLVRTLVRSFAEQIRDHGITVNIGDLPPTVADRTAMEQIVGSILDNALKYREPDRRGVVEITGVQTVSETIYHIKDNGRGIAADDVYKVFDLFRRVGSQDVPGEGMGLAYAKTLIRRHEGRIWCESELGKGSTFTFTIPLKAEVHNNQTSS
jgi:PAS domain S-box-containing protein